MDEQERAASDRRMLIILGGGAALVAHSAKAGTRGVVNASPEPVSNIVVSTGEDIATGGLLALAFAEPTLALVIAVLLLGAMIAMLLAARRLLGRLLGTGAEAG